MKCRPDFHAATLSLLLLATSLASTGFTCPASAASPGIHDAAPTAAAEGPPNQGVTFPRQDGDSAARRDVFRFETFGNEGFWTDAVRLPQGMIAAGVTPLKALQLGLQVDMDV
jgi:hypothetical protein